MEKKLHHKADGRTIGILADVEESLSGFGRSWLLWFDGFSSRFIAFFLCEWSYQCDNFMAILFPLSQILLYIVYLLL
jgi:hypothetical protein